MATAAEKSADREEEVPPAAFGEEERFMGSLQKTEKIVR